MSRILDQLQNSLSGRQKHLVRQAVQHLVPRSIRARYLTLLPMIYGSDKWKHGYIPHYRRFLDPIRLQKLTILEIGVGGHADPNSGGASLRMWQEYFPNSMIYAIDIHDKQRHQDRRVRIFRGSQNDPEFLRTIAAQTGPLDLVIDDGSHVNEHVITAFTTLFPFVAPNGIYVIEDLQTSYSPRYGGHAERLDVGDTSMAMLKRLLDSVHAEFMPPGLSTQTTDGIASIHVFPKIAFITKRGAE